jgi:hypothetical protein
MQKFQFLLLTLSLLFFLRRSHLMSELCICVIIFKTCFLTHSPTSHLQYFTNTFCITPLTLHMWHLSCVSDGLGQCLLPQTSTLVMCNSTLGGLPNGCFIVLSSGVPCECMCYTDLRVRRLCPLQGYWLSILFNWPTLNCILFVRGIRQNWTAGLVTTGCLVIWLSLWHPWHNFRTSLNWTDVTWYSHLVNISVNNQFRYFTWLATLATCLVHPPQHCEMLTWKNNKLSMKHWM